MSNDDAMEAPLPDNDLAGLVYEAELFHHIPPRTRTPRHNAAAGAEQPLTTRDVKIGTSDHIPEEGLFGEEEAARMEREQADLLQRLSKALGEMSLAQRAHDQDCQLVRAAC